MPRQMPNAVTAKQFTERLKAHSSAEEREKLMRYFKTTDGDQFKNAVTGYYADPVPLP